MQNQDDNRKVIKALKPLIEADKLGKINIQKLMLFLQRIDARDRVTGHPRAKNFSKIVEVKRIDIQPAKDPKNRQGS